MVRTGKIIPGVIAAVILTGVCMNQSIYAEEKSKDTSEEEIINIKEKIEEMPEARKVEYISAV